jgi:hypothetical protein
MGKGRVGRSLVRSVLGGRRASRAELDRTPLLSSQQAAPSTSSDRHLSSDTSTRSSRMLISLVGLPFSGKKEIARWLVAERGFRRVSLSSVRSSLSPHGRPAQASSGVSIARDRL